MSFVTRSVFDFLCLAGSWCTESDFGLHYKKFSYNSYTQRSHSTYAVYSLVQFSQSFSLRMSRPTLSTVKPIFNKNFLRIGSPRTPVFHYRNTAVYSVQYTLPQWMPTSLSALPSENSFRLRVYSDPTESTETTMTTNQNQLCGTTSQLMIHFAANREEKLLRARCTCG